MKPLFLGLFGVSAIGEGSAGVYLYVTSSKTVQDELKGMKLTSSLNLAPEEMKAQWKEEFDANKDAIKAVIKGITDDSKGGEVLEKWCSSSLSKPSEQSLVNNVKKWCTVYTVEEKARRNSKTLLNNDSTIGDWQSIWTKHTTSEKRAKIGLTGTKQSGQETNEIPTIKGWCDQNKKKDFLFKEKTSVYDVVVEWCSK